MKIQPQTEDQLAKAMLLPAGEYDFEVVTAEDRISKSGNEMIEVGLLVFAGDAKRTVKDYLMEKMAYKLRHYCYAVGLGKEYESGELTAALCVGRTGRVKLKVEEQDGFRPKNAVADYVVGATTDVPQKTAPKLPTASPAAAADPNEPPF